MSGELWRLSAAALAAAFARREVSPVEATEACLSQVERLNPQLNAIVTLDRDGALAAARAAAERWRRGAPLGQLDGAPLTVKDNIPVAGLRSAWGSRLLADYVPASDELAVARLRAAGAVILGKTNAPEFTVQGHTDNPLFGPTRNPWDPARTPGGSSGGAVAAVAAGMGPLALATDGGGSIRRPASHAGLVGFKPSRGRAARVDGFPLILLDLEVVGPIARSVADIVLAIACIGRPDHRDQASLAFAAPFEPAPPAARRILYVPRFGVSPVDPEVAASVAEAARTLQALGHHVEEGPLPLDLAPFDRAWRALCQAGVAWLLRWRDKRAAEAGPAIKEMGCAGAALSAADLLDAILAVAELRRAVAELFERWDMVLTPTAAALPWPIGQTHPPEIAGEAVGPRGHAVFTGFANAAGCPAMSLPCAPSQAGLPIGFQLVGRWGADASLCALAAQWEEARPWGARWPALCEAS